MARKPDIKGDRDNWGAVLNEYLDHLTPGPGEVVVGGPDGPVRVRDVNAASYGLRTNATWEQNRDALQAANDVVHAAGGGRVTIPAGTYLAKDVIQDSHVEFFGPGATLKHPDGLTGSIISSRTFTASGAIAADSTTLTVDDASNIEVGSVLIVRGAGGLSDRQSTTLTASITASDTSLPIASNNGWAPVGQVWIDDELVVWSSSSEGVFGDAERGACGTAAATHASGAVVYQAMALYTEVVAISGTTVTVSTPAVRGVSGAPVTIGSIRMGVTDLSFDGSRHMPDGSASNPMPLRWHTARWSRISGGDWANGDLGAIYLGSGTRDCTIMMPTIRDSGMPGPKKGAGIWMFRGVVRNRVLFPTIYGKCYNGIYIDDRTQGSSELDAPSSNNITIAPIIDVETAGDAASWMVVGGNGNQLIGGSTRGSRVGVIIDANQGSRHDGGRPATRGNLVFGVDMANHTYPVQIRVPGNRIVSNAWHDSSLYPYDWVAGNHFEGNGIDHLHRTEFGRLRGSQFGGTTVRDGYHWTGSNGAEKVSTPLTNGTLIAVPFDIPRTMTLTEVGVEVVTPSAIGSRLRFGYYFDDGKGRPGQLAWDAGPSLIIDISEAGMNYISLSRTLAPNRVWLAGAVQNVPPGSEPVIRVASGPSQVSAVARPTKSESLHGYIHNGSRVSGLPSAFDVLDATPDAPLMFVRLETPSL